MYIVSYEHESGIRGGVLIEDSVHDLELLLQASSGAVSGSTTSVREFLELYGDRIASMSTELSALAAQDPEARVGARSEVRLTTPVPDPAEQILISHPRTLPPRRWRAARWW